MFVVTTSVEYHNELGYVNYDLNTNNNKNIPIL